MPTTTAETRKQKLERYVVLAALGSVLEMLIVEGPLPDLKALDEFGDPAGRALEELVDAADLALAHDLWDELHPSTEAPDPVWELDVRLADARVNLLESRILTRLAAAPDVLAQIADERAALAERDLHRITTELAKGGDDTAPTA